MANKLPTHTCNYSLRVWVFFVFFLEGVDFDFIDFYLYLPTYLLIFYSSSPARFRTRCFNSRSCQRHWNILHIQKHYPYKNTIPDVYPLMNTNEMLKRRKGFGFLRVAVFVNGFFLFPKQPLFDPRAY